MTYERDGSRSGSVRQPDARLGMRSVMSIAIHKVIEELRRRDFPVDTCTFDISYSYRGDCHVLYLWRNGEQTSADPALNTPDVQVAFSIEDFDEARLVNRLLVSIS